MMAFENVAYWHISEIPKGWTIGERVGAAKAMRGVGVQSNPNPALVSHMRPKVPTTYDEEGEPTQTADEWILAGDLDNVTRDDIVQAIASELEINPTAVDTKIQIVEYGHAGILGFLAANPAWDGVA